MTKSSIYALLNAEAKAWWHHLELRRNGHHAEARRRERQSIKSNLETFRAAALMTIGRGGWSIDYPTRNGRASLQGHGDGEPYATICRRLGVPVVDSREAPIDKVARVAISGPMPAIGQAPDPAPWGAMSYAPVAHIVELWRQAGAKVWNQQAA